MPKLPAEQGAYGDQQRPVVGTNMAVLVNVGSKSNQMHESRVQSHLMQCPRSVRNSSVRARSRGNAATAAEERKMVDQAVMQLHG